MSPDNWPSSSEKARELADSRRCGICWGDLIELRIDGHIPAVACPVHGIRWRRDHGYVRGRQSDAFHRESAPDRP